MIAVAVRWYLRYGLSYRDFEELLAERERPGDARDHRLPRRRTYATVPAQATALQQAGKLDIDMRWL